jgi:2-iminoacetate synthase
MSFCDVFSDIEQDDLLLQLYSKQAADVERAFIAPQGNLESLMALLSPAAAPYIETMAAESMRLTRQRFGNNLGLYLPLYLSNLCANECDYCGFTMSNKIKRKTLNEAELLAEINIIKSRGFDSILLVSGEHESKVGMDYFAWVIPIVKDHFSYLAIEVQPLSEADYALLKELGVDAVMVYQETYRPVTYAQHHTRGQKMNFQHRLTAADRAAKAGIDKIGLGVLLGLDDWRLDALIMGHHIDYLEKNYWRTRYSISLPRLRPCTGGVTPKVPLTDLGLVQLMCAFRLFNSQLEISLSTRESEQLRDNLLPLGVTHLSAGSSTQPGGYQAPQTQLDQFEISDSRSVEFVVAQIQQQGFTPVWKDWEAAWR